MSIILLVYGLIGLGIVICQFITLNKLHGRRINYGDCNYAMYKAFDWDYTEDDYVNHIGFLYAIKNAVLWIIFWPILLIVGGIVVYYAIKHDILWKVEIPDVEVKFNNEENEES